MTIQALFYDQDGNRITGTPQTAVNGVPGQFYMSLQILTSNTGNAPLTNVRIQESHSAELTNALQGASAIQPNLAVGESNVLQWDTANTCSIDAQCGTGEKCVANSCLIDISNFLGQMTFGATIEADFTDAVGNPNVISTLINLGFNFEQDEVVFRTNAPVLSSSPISLDFSSSGNQIVVDKMGDGTMEAYTRVGSGLESTYLPSSFVGWTPDNKLVFQCFTDRVCVSRSQGLDKDVSHSNVNRDHYDLGGSLPTTNSPSEPYQSQNCGGLIPCQERYSTVIAPPPQTCGNNVLEGTELCDGTDLGGDTCVSINQGFDGGTLQCGGSCDAWDTTQCTAGGGGQTVVFRTNVNLEDYFNDWNKWIALDWDDSQGGYVTGTLVGYGSRTKTTSGTSSRCSTTTSCSSNPSIPCIVGTTPSGLKITDYGSSTRVIVCTNPSSDREQAFFEKGDADASTAVLTTTPTEPYTSNGQEVSI